MSELDTRPAGDLDPAGPPVPVDPAPVPRTIVGTALAVRDAQRRPVVPGWARDRGEAAHLLRWLARYGAHVVLFHLTRSPLYLLRLAAHVPRGLAVAVAAGCRWVFDAEGSALRVDAVRRGDSGGYMTLSRQRNERVKLRGIVAAVAVLGMVVVVVLARWAPAPVPVVALVVVALVLGKVGTPPDVRIVAPATVSGSAPPRLTAEVVTRALQAVGVAGLSAKGATISYPAPITRDGPGWRADVDLPHGVTVADVVANRDRLASGLRRPLSAVWPEPSSEQHAGRLILWVGDQPLNRVRPVLVTLAETNVLIGALPGGGKTAAVRVLALAGALDVHCELRIGEHKGSGDLEALGLVAHRYVSGVDDEALAATLESLRELLAEVGRRAKVLQGLPRSVVPDRKVTPELAARPGSGLHPIVQVIDEAQELFTHPELGKEAGEIAERIIKRGRAFGVILIVATQRPDAKSVPTGVSGNVGFRFCLRVTGQVENDLVLGTSAYRNGVRATTLTPTDRGIGYLVGASDDPQVVRTYYLDADDAQRIAVRARAAREAAGLLSGYAAGQVEEPRLTAAAQLLDDLAVVFADLTVERVWSETVVDRLREVRPVAYDGWTPENLTAAVKPFGITTGQVWGRTADGAGANRRGVTRDEVMAAIATHRPARPEITR